MTGYLHADVPAAFHAQACFQRIFQEIGEHQAHVDFIHRNPGGQVDLCGKRNLSPPGKRTVVAYHAVCSLIFTKRNGEVRNFAGSTGEIRSYFLDVALFGQSGQLKKMMAHIMPCLSGFLDGGAEAVVPRLLQQEKMIRLLQSGVSVQAVCHEQKHGVEQDENHQKDQAEHDVDLQNPTRIECIVTGRNHEYIQTDKEHRQNPENIPGLSKVLILDHHPDRVCGRIPGGKQKQKTDAII